MSDDLCKKVQLNWLSIKDEVSARCERVSDEAFQVEILDLNDLQTICSKRTDSEKIHFILMKVVQLKKCDQFLTILERLGFELLCRTVRETVVQAVQRGVTYVIEDSDEKGATGGGPVTEEARFENVLNTFTEKQEIRDAELRQYIDDKFDMVVDLKTEISGFVSKLGDFEDKYKTLQHSHNILRERNNELTKLARDKTMDVYNLKREVSNLQGVIKGLEERLSEANSLIDRKMVNEYRETIAGLETNYNAKCEELRTLEREIGDQELKIKLKENELTKENRKYQKLREENEDLRRKHGENITQQAHSVIRRLEKLVNVQGQYHLAPDRQIHVGQIPQQFPRGRTRDFRSTKH